MKRVLRTFVILALIGFSLYGMLCAWYLIDAKSSYHDRPDLELFIADRVFQDYHEPYYEEFDFKDFPREVWKDKNNENAPEVVWLLDETDLHYPDSVEIGMVNNDKKFYYMSWGAPNSRLRDEAVIYRNGEGDSIKFGGFGCGTGIYLEPFERGEEASKVVMNPLLYDPSFIKWEQFESDSLFSDFLYAHPLDFGLLSTDTLPEAMRKAYGDSIHIRYSVASYSLPWSRRESQMLFSPWISINTDTLISNCLKWKRLRSATSSSQH